MIKALEHLSTFPYKADLNLCLPTYLHSLLSTKSATEEFLVEEFQAFFICDGNETASECKKQGAGGIIPFLPSPSHFSSFVTHPSLLLPIFSAHRRHACLLAPARSLRLQNGKETSATHAACCMPQNSRSLQSNHVLSPIKISACSRTKIAEERTSYKGQPVTHLFRCD